MAAIENRIFINRVPQTAKREDLAAHFSQFGATLDVFMPAAFGAPGLHKGICFVTYATQDAVDMALKFPAHVIHGQQVTVEMCMAKKGEGKGLPGVTNSGERVFITNIGPAVTQEEVQAYFAQWGDWTDLFMPRGSFPAGHKGICFISYKDPAAVAQVLQHGTHQLRGQPIVVDVAVPRGDSRGFGKGLLASPGPGQITMPQQLPCAGQPLWPVEGMLHAAAAGAGGGSQSGGTLPGRLFITKMDRAITKEDLMLYFQQFGELNDVYIPPGGKLIAFVGFHDASAAQALLLHKTHEIKPGCTVDVDAAVERPPLDVKGMGKARFQPY